MMGGKTARANAGGRAGFTAGGRAGASQPVFRRAGPGRGRNAAARPASRAGFTFTLSIVLLSLTLIAVASFASEWRKTQQVSFTEMLPSEAMRLQERVGSDMGQIVQADASLRKTSPTSTTLSISTQQPFKREGEPIAKISDYSESLPANLRNLGYEAVLSANEISGSDTTLLLLSGNGSLVHSNDGAYDITTFYHPNNVLPESITANIHCDKQAESVGDIVLLSGSGASTYHYIVNYTEPGGRSYLKDFHAPYSSNVSMRIVYPDKSLLYFDSQFSPSLSQNRTSVHYTKSSSGALILPFSANASGVVRDYSLFKENVTLAAGSSAPVWKADCSHGGCYYFDGTGRNIFVPGGVALTDAEIPLPLGEEKMRDPWLDTLDEVTCPATFDDGKTDGWYYWSIEGSACGGQDNAFDVTSDAQTGYAVHAITTQSNSEANIYYRAMQLSPSTPYTLNFWSKGTGAGRYAVQLSSGQCLQSDGGWSAQACGNPFSVAPASSYTRTTREFILPPGNSPIDTTIRLYPPSSPGSAYFDSVSLKQSYGMNGGFESYYAEDGFVPAN